AARRGHARVLLARDGIPLRPPRGRQARLPGSALRRVRRARHPIRRRRQARLRRLRAAGGPSPVSNWLAAAGNLARRQQRRVALRAKWAAKAGEEGVKDTRHAIRRAGERIRDDVLNVVKAWFKRARRPVRTALRRRKQLGEQWEFYQAEWGIERELETIVSRGRTLVVGPWLSEVGFETLYWLPFLHWVKA